MKIALVDLCGEGDVNNEEKDTYWRNSLKLLNEQGIAYIDFASGKKTSSEKLFAFHEALHSDAELIWFVRGGYCCVDALPYIDWDLVRRSKKMFYGLSDFTHFAWMASREGLPCYYGQSLTNFETYFSEPKDREFVYSFLKNGNSSTKVTSLFPELFESRDLSKEKVIGGHLVVFLLMFLQYPVNLSDRYIFLEYHPGGVGEGLRDIGYYLEHLVSYLERTHNLPKGFVFGHSTLPQQDGSGMSWTEINAYCKDRVSRLGLPVYELDHFKNVVSFNATQ